MKKQAIFVLALVLGVSGFVFAQTKTVTNADLAKYRQKRLQAEKDLRENYREMGFSSPEELERRNEEDKQKLSELSQKLREERLQKESLKLERERLNAEREYMNTDNGQSNSAPVYPYPNPSFVDYSQYGVTTYIYPGYWRRPYFHGNQPRNFGRFNDFRQTEFFRRNKGNTNRPAFRGDIRLNRFQRFQTRRGNSRVFTGVGVVRSIRGN